jgi:hypothetical protein
MSDIKELARSAETLHAEIDFRSGTRLKEIDIRIVTS